MSARTKTASSTAILERKIANEKRRKARLLSSKDYARAQRMKEIRLPQLLAEVILHNMEVQAAEQVLRAARDAQALMDFISRPRQMATFRKSYAFESWSEAVLLGRETRAGSCRALF